MQAGVESVLLRDAALSASLEWEVHNGDPNGRNPDGLVETVRERFILGSLAEDPSAARFSYLFIEVGMSETEIAAVRTSERLAGLPMAVASAGDGLTPGAGNSQLCAEIVRAMSEGVNQIVTGPALVIPRSDLEVMAKADAALLAGKRKPSKLSSLRYAYEKPVEWVRGTAQQIAETRRHKRILDQTRPDPQVLELERMVSLAAPTSMIYVVQVAGQNATRGTRAEQQAFFAQLGRRLADQDHEHWFTSVIVADTAVSRRGLFDAGQLGIRAKGSESGYDFSLESAAPALVNLQRADTAILERRGTSLRRTVVIFAAVDSPLVGPAGLAAYARLCNSVDACLWVDFSGPELPISESLQRMGAGVYPAHPDVAEEVLSAVLEGRSPIKNNRAWVTDPEKDFR